MSLDQALVAKARSLKLISFDVDGVLTDGRIIYSDDGRESKAFNVQDGSAIKLLMAQGIQVALLTGRRSSMVERRATELGITLLEQGLEHKGPALDALAGRLNIAASAIAHVGDDLPDLELFERVGFAISVPNGHPVVKARADYVTATNGGAGVARELAELLLKARGDWPY